MRKAEMMFEPFIEAWVSEKGRPPDGIDEAREFKIAAKWFALGMEQAKTHIESVEKQRDAAYETCRYLRKNIRF
jgi:hypothetical protein